MSLRNYKPKTKPALWLSTPQGKAKALRNEAERVARQERLKRARRARQVDAGRLRGRSDRMAAAMALYVPRRAKFLLEHPYCWACSKYELAKLNRSQDVHHCRGRLGALLLDERHWRALCREHHDRVRTDHAWAIALGLLPSDGQWNTQPSETL